jgi:integrase
VSGLLDVTHNPISLVKNQGSTQKTRKPRSLTTAQFRVLLRELREPFGTMALVSVCLGLRISGTVGLQWGDVDWLGSKLSIRRGVVERVVDDVKTVGSARTFDISSELPERLRCRKRDSHFSELGD